MTQQPRYFVPILIRRCFLTRTRNKEIPRFIVTKRRGKITHHSGLSLPRENFIIPKLLGFLQMVQMNKFVHPFHITLLDEQPNLHISNYDPPRIRYKLSQGYLYLMKEFHNARMDRESKIVHKASIIKKKTSSRMKAQAFSSLQIPYFVCL